MSKITSVNAREILDSRGNPTVEVNLSLDEVKATASVPSGASTGTYEALELRDGDKNRYDGLGVLKAIKNVNEEIKTNIIDKEFSQEELDNFLIKLDGTENKSRLGANAILGVSMAFAKASALSQGKELYEYLGGIIQNNNFEMPQPMFNVINGGKHADSGLDIQEFMLAPIKFDNFKEKVRVSSEIIHALKNILKEKGYGTSVGDEGGFAPKLKSNEEAFELIIEAIEKAGYTTELVKIGMDVAASSLLSENLYYLKIDGKSKKISSEELIRWYETLVDKYPIILIEDGLEENDWNGFISLNKKLGDKITIVGDDLLVTNINKIQQAVDKKAVNSALIKLNQIGTVTETIQAIELTKKQGWKPFVSHRSGETTDTFIADLAVGLSCSLIKSGSLVRGERVCKYNRLMEIETLLEPKYLRRQMIDTTNKEYWKKVPAGKTLSSVIRPSDEDLNDVPISGNVLDVGCGDGQLSEWLSKKGFHVSAFDINQNAIESNIKRKTKVNYSVQDISKKTTFGSEFFDFLCFKYPLANIHKKEWPAVRKEINRLVSSKGFVWLVEPLISNDYKSRYELAKIITKDEHTMFVFKNPETAKNITTMDQLQNAIDQNEIARISRHYAKKELIDLFPNFKIIREKIIEDISPSGFKLNTYVGLLQKE